jgi:DegV family protein with EDD domain
MAMASARAARAGKDMQGIIAQINYLIPCTRVYGLLDTLKYVVKGGRLAKVGPVISSVLPIKPLLTMKGGRVSPIGAARTRVKGIERLLELVRSVPMIQQLGIAHSAVEEEITTFVDKVKSIMPDVTPVVSKLGPALGVHGGPGAILVGIQQDVNAAAGDRESREHMIPITLPSLQSIKDRLRQRRKEHGGKPFSIQCNGAR